MPQVKEVHQIKERYDFNFIETPLENILVIEQPPHITLINASELAAVLLTEAGLDASDPWHYLKIQELMQNKRIN
jgi:hypothetical protein